MARNHSIFLLTLAAVSADVGEVAGHVGERLIPINYLSEETLARLDFDDATVEDWIDSVGEPSLTPLDFFLWSHPSLASYDQFDPSNLDFRIWLGWSRDGRIHVAGQFADNVYENTFGIPFSSFDDSIALLVDGDHTGGEYVYPTPGDLGVPDGPDLTNMQAQNYEAIARIPRGLTVDLLWTSIGRESSIDWMVGPPFAFGGGSVQGENPTVWIVEFSITCFDQLDVVKPEDSIISQLSEGRIIGLDLHVFDHDLENTRRHARYSLSDPELRGGGEGADNFADALLLGPESEFGDSAVQSLSWGLIKASLEIDSHRNGSYPDR